MTSAEREITAPVSLCLPNGRLNPDAVGWCRTPIIDTDRIGHGAYGWGRNKRWEYWAVTTPTHIVTLTVSCLDYASLNAVWVFDRATGEEIDRTTISPLQSGVVLPGSLGNGPASATAKNLNIQIDETPGGTRLRATTERVSLDVLAARPEGHESMGVVVPWTKRLFQYTVKDVARPASGTIRVDGTEHMIASGESWAVLDHGRGRWPYSMTWNWAAASGVTDGQVIGLQFGGKWTEGTGSTENALLVGTRLHKISEELHWDYDMTDWMRPWHLSGDRVSLEFTPFHDRVSTTNLGVIASNTHQLFGHFSGWVADDAGTRVRVESVLGWAEHVENRW